MLADDTRAVSLTDFVERFEAKLRQALTAAFGPELGREATADALAYGWEHWDKVGKTDNPAGYLYRVGYNRALRSKPKRVRLPGVDVGRQPWIEPGLPNAFESLPEQQRTVVMLLHGCEWSMSEVAEQLGISKSTVQTRRARTRHAATNIGGGSMSTGLLVQIQAYASDIDSSQPPVTADEVAERIDLVRELPVAVSRTRPARGVWTMVAGAALVALLLAVPLLASRLRSGTPPATVPDAPTTTAPTVDALPLSAV